MFSLHTFVSVSASQIYPRSPRAWLEVDLSALRRNAVALADLAGAPIIPMVKANGYGVGAAQVVRALEPAEPWAYGVATVREGEELRALGIERRVLVLTPLLPEEFSSAANARLTPALERADDVAAWGARGPYHLHIDTGMSRAGAAWRELSALREVVRAHPPEGVLTHLHSAELDDGSVHAQEQCFRQALAALAVQPQMLHVANSAAIVRRHARGWGAVRPGIFLYGVGSGTGALIQPEPVVQLHGRVVSVRALETGDTVSYGGTYRASARRRIATVALGYADGYPRALSNRGVALIRGQRAPVCGRVTMDMTMLDVSDLQGPPCERGETATVIGSSGSATLSVADVAGAARMSPYELLTGLGTRLERYYHG